MQAVVIVNGEVDERDVWPYATWCDSDGVRTTLTVRVHDSQELVSVLGTLTAMGLEVTSTQLMEEPGAAGPGRAGRDP